MNINVKIEDGEVRALLGRIKERAKSMTPAMKIIGEVVAQSVRKNFDEGGRPAWPLSGRVKKHGGKTLIKRGQAGGLLGSIHWKAYADRAEVSASKVYAAVHQFGFSGTVNIPSHSRKVKTRDIGKGKKQTLSGVGFVKAHSRKMNIPARPFLMVQNEDWGRIKQAIGDWLAK